MQALQKKPPQQRKGFDIELQPLNAKPEPAQPSNSLFGTPSTITTQANPFIQNPQYFQANPYIQPANAQYPFVLYAQPQNPTQMVSPLLPQTSTAPPSYSSSVFSQTPISPRSNIYPGLPDQNVTQNVTENKTQNAQNVVQKPQGNIEKPKSNIKSTTKTNERPKSLERPKSPERIKSPERPKSLETMSLDQVITKRCLQCNQYYTDLEIAQNENKTPCRYHPGTFKRTYSSPLLSGAAIQYWSCCKSTNKSELGCKQTVHKEDPQMIQIQQNFSRNLLSNKIPQTQIGILIDNPFGKSEAEENLNKTDEKPKHDIKLKSVVRHYVTEADTLIGLSFRYGVPARAIRQLNRMLTDDVQAYSRLYIPKKGHAVNTLDMQSDDEEATSPQDLNDAERSLFEKRMILKMKASTGMSIEEAQYYMGIGGFSFNEAMKEYNEDVEWEKKSAFVPAKKCK